MKLIFLTDEIMHSIRFDFVTSSLYTNSKPPNQQIFGVIFTNASGLELELFMPLEVRLIMGRRWDE